MSKENGKKERRTKKCIWLSREHQYLPSIMHITQAAYNDVTFSKNIHLPGGSTVVMDRAGPRTIP